MTIDGFDAYFRKTWIITGRASMHNEITQAYSLTHFRAKYRVFSESPLHM